MSKTMAHKDKNGGAVDVLVQQIRQYIYENQLAVGDNLPSERDLGTRFAAARNTVREAIRILKAYGVIDVRPKVGAVLVDRHMDAIFDVFSFQIGLSRETFLDIQNFRRLIEVNSVDRLFKNLDDDIFAQLAAINETLRQSDTVEKAAEIDFNFHSTLLETTGNRTLVTVYKSMRPMIGRLMETGKETDGLESTYEAHVGILQALQKRDRLAYMYLMDQHLDHGLSYIENSLGHPRAKENQT
ncbi:MULTISPECIES: FCD domain-containing protein [Roseobacteraceae]|uniref:FadR/GntR family transcriptional regulator n=1 Tax=Roseobacteraceae TaxID=2854170 RepID=UPI003298C46A